MQRLPSDKLLRYQPDTLMTVRKAYNLEKPGQMEQAVDLLEAWVQKQGHFIKRDFSREYLERVIIQLKGSVERAKSQLDKICTLRTLLPRYFDICNPQQDFKDLNGYFAHTLLPNLTKENNRIYIVRLNENVPYSQHKLFLIYKYAILIYEYIKMHDYCDGVIAIFDIRGVHVTDLVASINLTDLQQMTTIVMEGYDTRLKAIHYLSTSKAIGMLLKIVKQVLSAKIANRINVFKTLEELYELVPRDLLPKDYGGNEKTLDDLNEKCLQVFSSEENQQYWKDMRNTRTNESRRLQNSTFNESDLGIAGSFRTLNVD